jgi:hypothetical protein
MHAMNKPIRIFVSLLILSVVAVFSFLTGELIGLKTGYAHTKKMTAPMDAAYLVSVLNLIENNRVRQAKEMLNQKLDTYVMDHWSAGRCRLMGLNPFIKETNQKELFYPIITYRKVHPSQSDDDRIREVIRTHLNAMEKEI